MNLPISRCVVVGTIVADFKTRVELAGLTPGDTRLASGMELSVGGNAARCAATLGRLGAQVALLGDIGADHWGSVLMESVLQAGVEACGVLSHRDQRTSTTLALIQSDGQWTLLHDPGANACTDERVLCRLQPPLGEADLLFVAGARLMPGLGTRGVETLFRQARDRGAVTVYDTTLDPARESGERLLSIVCAADVFCTSMGEAHADWGIDSAQGVAEHLARVSDGWVVVKDGPAGAVATRRGGDVYRCSPTEARAVDTTGAGDNFMAGLIAGLSRGLNVTEAVRLGVAAGTLSVRESGDLHLRLDPAQLEDETRRVAVQTL